MEIIYNVDYENCDYCGYSYCESDTGYKEFSCDLTGLECMGGYIDSGCPLAFKYEVED